MLIGGIVDRVVGNGGSEGAGNDALQRAGAGNTTELNVLEQEAGGVIKGGDAMSSNRKREASLKAVMLVRVSPYVRPKRVNESFFTG